MSRFLRMRGDFCPSLLTVTDDSAGLGGSVVPHGHGLANEVDKPCPWTSSCMGKPSPWLWRPRELLPCPKLYIGCVKFVPVRKLAVPTRLCPSLEAPLAVASQMKLINLAHGHPPRSKSHPHGSGGLRSCFYAPIPAHERQFLPLRPHRHRRFGWTWWLCGPSWSWPRK